MNVNLTGSLVEPPERSDDAEFDPNAVVVALTRGIRSPLRLAPYSATARLVDLLRSQERVFEVFEAVGRGVGLQQQADDLGIPYLALVALFESDDPSITALRRMVRTGLAAQDRAIARQIVRAAPGGLTESEKRLVDASIGMAKAEDPAPPASHSTKVNVGVSFGDALVAHHKAARQVVTIEHRGDDDGSDLGI